MDNEVIQKILDNRVAMIIGSLVAAAMAIVTIVIGFRLAYGVIAFLRPF